MSEFYGARDERESIATIHRALELGVTFLDTADMYGPLTNEELVGRAIARSPRRGRAGDEVRHRPRADDARLPRRQRQARVRPRRRAKARLERLGVDTIDLYYQHRVDPRRADRGDGRRDGRAGRGRARCASSGSPRRRRRRSAARTPSTRSRRCRPSTRSGAATRRTRCCRPCASSGSASSPTARSAAASSPGAIRALRRPRGGRLPPHHPALPGRELRAQPRPRRAGARDRRARRA